MLRVIHVTNSLKMPFHDDRSSALPWYHALTNGGIDSEILQKFILLNFFKIGHRKCFQGCSFDFSQ